MIIRPPILNVPSLTQYFGIQLNEQTPRLCLRDVQGKKTLVAEQFPAEKKIMGLIKQARLFEIMAEKVTLKGKFDPLSKKYISEKAESKLQALSEVILQLTSINQCNSADDLSAYEHFAEALMWEARAHHKLYLNLMSPLNSTNSEPSGEHSSPISVENSSSNFSGSLTNSISESPRDITEVSGNRIEFGADRVKILQRRKRLSGLNAAWQTPFFEPTLKVNSESEGELSDEQMPNLPIDTTIVDYFNKEKVLEASFLLWGLTHGKSSNKTGQKREKKTEFYKDNQKEIAPYIKREGLNSIAFDMIDTVLKKPRVFFEDGQINKKFQVLGHDICRQMKFIKFHPSQINNNEPIIRGGNNSNVEAVKCVEIVNYFEYILKEFITHFNMKDKDFRIEVLTLWDNQFGNIKQNLEKQVGLPPSDFSLSTNTVAETFTAFLDEIFSRASDPQNFKMQHLSQFLKTMDQQISVLPFKALRMALESDEKHLGEIIEKSNGRRVDYSFGESCFIVHATQRAIIEKTNNLDIKISTIVSYNFDNPDPWNIKQCVNLGVSDVVKKVADLNETKISLEEFKIIKKNLMPTLKKSGFQVKISEELNELYKKVNIKSENKNLLS